MEFISENLFNQKMTTLIPKLYPSALRESKNEYSQQRLRGRINGSFRFNISIKEMINQRDEKHKSRKINEKYKTLTSIIESVDTVVIIGATTNSVTSSFTGVGLAVVTVLLGLHGLHLYVTKYYIR